MKASIYDPLDGASNVNRRLLWIWELRANGHWCAAPARLGFGCAQALVREGVNVVINARNADVLAQAAAKLIAASAEYASARGQKTHNLPSWL